MLCKLNVEIYRIILIIYISLKKFQENLFKGKIYWFKLILLKIVALIANWLPTIFIFSLQAVPGTLLIFYYSIIYVKIYL